MKLESYIIIRSDEYDDYTQPNGVFNSLQEAQNNCPDDTEKEYYRILRFEAVKS